MNKRKLNGTYDLRMASNIFVFFAGLFWVISVILAVKADGNYYTLSINGDR